MVDAAGYTMPAGTVAVFQVTGDQLIAFVTDDDVTVPAGATATEAGEVELVALEAGSAPNGLTPQPMQLLDSLVYVDSVVSTTT